MTSGVRSIEVDYLARVEGEGALRLRIADGRVETAELAIFEPPRYFEALLRGRAFAEAPDITARICGICPVAYQMSAVHAMEAAAGVAVSEPIRRLRRLLYCGEWIESHALHVYMLHAPDFYGLPDAVALARLDPDRVRRGLALKQAGNAILRTLGGREIHPINVKVGGFYRAPEPAELHMLIEPLTRAREIALETVEWVAGFDYPESDRDWELVALRHDSDYPMNEGRVVSTAGIDIPVTDFVDVFEERQAPHSTALHAAIVGRGAYLTGPLARFALNRDRLRPLARRAADGAGLGPECRNPFKSAVVRAVEIVHAVDEALELIDGYVHFAPAAIAAAPRSAVGQAATEAPRGLLYHRYVIDGDGLIAEAQITPPTSQNQASIEADVVAAIDAMLATDPSATDDDLRAHAETAIRNHDPCISCATHFLKLEVERPEDAAR